MPPARPLNRLGRTNPTFAPERSGSENPYLKEALQTMFETGLPAIVYEETTGEAYHPVDGARHVR